MMKAVERIRMANMPFDKFENGTFVHATGFEVLCTDGEWYVEYEDMEFIDADDCIFEEEEEEEEEELEYHCIYEDSDMTVEA